MRTRSRNRIWGEDYSVTIENCRATLQCQARFSCLEMKC